MEVFTEASLSDSTIWNKLNKATPYAPKAIEAIKTGTVVDKTFIEEQYLQISRTHVSQISEKVLRAYDNGEIKLVYNSKQKLGISVPFIILQMNNRPTAVIFIADFSALNKDGTSLTIDMKKLYVLMESAYIGLKFYTNPILFNRNSAFIKTAASIYGDMFMRILNRDYALSLTKDVYDTVYYAINRFFIEKVIGVTTPSLAHSYAESLCNNPSQVQIAIAKDGYERANINDIVSLIIYISNQSSKMENLTFRYFFERWIASFGPSTTLALDSFPYFFFVISNIIIGGFMVNANNLNEIVKNAKGIREFYPELSRIA